MRLGRVQNTIECICSEFLRKKNPDKIWENDKNAKMIYAGYLLFRCIAFLHVWHL